MFTQQSKDLLSGKYGQTVKPFNKEVQKKAIGDVEPITCRPADKIPPQLPEMEKAVAEYKQQDEDVLSYALFPQVATDFFKYRQAQDTGFDASKGDTVNKTYPV
jgi:oxaloacetate decarboxylase alpha subunit